MLKAQLAILGLFVAAAIYIVLLPPMLFLLAPLVLSGYALYLALTQLKLAFRRDYPAYRSFVGMCIAIAWVFVLALRHLQLEFTLETLHLALVPPVLAIGFVFVAFMAFRLKYGRDFTYGIVESVRGRRAIVRVGYDICSNVKHGIYVVESLVKVKPGDEVRLSVERPMLGLRGARIKTVLRKVH
jgi:uncharacterized membrane protein